jgi:uncharacterized protein (TIRG00374 family)
MPTPSDDMLASGRDTASTPGRGTGGGWRLGLTWLTGLLILALVLLVGLHFSELEAFAQLLRAAQPIWLAAALILQAATYLAAAAVWHRSLLHLKAARPFWSIVPLGLAKLFADQALPTGGIGGTLLVMRALGRRGIALGIAMAALLIGMISFYAAYLGCVLAALLLLYFHHALDIAMIGAVVLFLCVAVSIPAAILALRHWSAAGDGAQSTRLHAWLRRVPGIATLLRALAEAPAGLARDPRPFLLASMLQVSIFLLDAATLWVMLVAIGADASPTSVFAAFMMASLAATIGPMPLGLGTFEAVCVAMLHLQGQSIETALTATMLLRGFTFWLPMLPGLLITRRELRPHPVHSERAV